MQIVRDANTVTVMTCRLPGATRPAGGLVRDDQTTEQQAVWGDQAGGGAVGGD